LKWGGERERRAGNKGAAAATLDEPAAAGVPCRAGAQRAGAEAREARRGRLMRGPERAGEGEEAGGAGRKKERQRFNLKNKKYTFPGLQNSPIFK
jgi:hypothetical protein